MPAQRRVFLLPHDALWADAAAARVAQIGAILGPVMITCHHIGSTSIPGIQAKPVIDLLPLVTSNWGGG